MLFDNDVVRGHKDQARRTAKAKYMIVQFQHANGSLKLGIYHVLKFWVVMYERWIRFD
jgi:hypothetical protein